MTSDAPLETIYDEIGHVRSLLREKPIAQSSPFAGRWGSAKTSGEEGQRAGGFTRRCVRWPRLPFRCELRPL